MLFYLSFSYSYLFLFDCLGNWDRDTQDARYSGHCPLSALRVMAGFGKNDVYFLPRGRARPSERLCSMVWTWIDYALAYFNSGGNENATAVRFLEWMNVLRSILLQDAAEMMIRNENAEIDPDNNERRNFHTLFKEPVFVCDEFVTFVDEMRVVLLEGIDPNDSTIEKAMPGVNRKFEDVIQQLHAIYRTGDDRDKKLDAIITRLGAQDEFLLLLRQELHAEREENQTAITAIFDHGKEVFAAGGDQMRASIRRRHEQSVVVTELQTRLSESHGGEEATPGVEGVEDGIEETVQADVTLVAVESDEEILRRVVNINLSFRNINAKRLCLLRMYEEFYGLSDYINVPIPGGFHGLEKRFKTKWRQHFTSNDNMFLSRLKSIFVGLISSVGVEAGDWTDALIQKGREWQVYLENYGLAGCVEVLKKNGFIVKNGARSRRVPSQSTVVVGDPASVGPRPS